MGKRTAGYLRIRDDLILMASKCGRNESEFVEQVARDLPVTLRASASRARTVADLFHVLDDFFLPTTVDDSSSDLPQGMSDHSHQAMRSNDRTSGVKDEGRYGGRAGSEITGFRQYAY